jgi:hypothetical protein
MYPVSRVTVAPIASNKILAISLMYPVAKTAHTKMQVKIIATKNVFFISIPSFSNKIGAFFLFLKLYNL